MHTVQLAYTVRPLHAVPLMDTVERVLTVPGRAGPAAPGRPSPVDRP